MCNIAAYVGRFEATPILIEMMRKEQGFNGGFYTGLVTLKNGRLGYEKLMGDLDYLLKNTPAAKLQGTIGLMHSRSNAKGGDEWAHPFVDGFNKEPEIAYVANGNAGCCSGRRMEYTAIAERLLSEGYKMYQLKDIQEKYIELKDGSTVHMSDLMCQLIMEYINKGLASDAAMEAAFCEMPGEIVGLMLKSDEPDRITFTRYNFPMFAGFAEHGAFLSSTPVAFPEDVTRVIPIPPMSFGYITADELVIKPMKKPGITVSSVGETERRQIYDILIKAMKDEALKMPELTDMVIPLFPPADCPEPLEVIHEVLYSLKKEDRIIFEERRLPGAREGLTAPKLYMKLK